MILNDSQMTTCLQIHVNPWLPNAAKRQALASKDFSLPVSSKLSASPRPAGQIQAPAKSKSARLEQHKFNVIKDV